jgi:hypothetical protein
MHGETALALQVSRHLLSQINPAVRYAPSLSEAQRDWERARAILPVVRAFADNGIPPDELMRDLDFSTNVQSSLARPKFDHLLTEANTAVVLRQFKRAARTFLATSDRASWDVALENVIGDRKDIADQLTYDPPLA